MSTSFREDRDHVPTIPPAILQTVKQHSQGPNLSKKPTPTLKLPPLSILTSPHQGGLSPANIWHHSNQRQKFKHLMERTQCVCGAGRDISFLYDSKQEHKKGPGGNDSTVPQSLIPEEYHIVKNTGVLGLLIHDEPYSVNLENHEKHLTVFPSLKPSGRQEVVSLKGTLKQMVDKIGLCDLETDLTGPTQMHNLIALVRKEQEIYNVCFHELIRQVSVGCIERGSLLADIRDCYANLLNRIPIQVKSLHDEVLAQRALDRKITTELGKFRDLMSSLTSELSELKEQNEQAGGEIEDTKTELSMAISESEKNANLLLEYSELYELQRKRLEDHIVFLAQEKDLWEHTSYQLALKVAKKRQLKTVQRIQLSGKSWEKLGTHFTILMADKNTKDLCSIQEEVLQWRKELVDFTENLLKVEEHLGVELLQIEEDMQKWLGKLTDSNTSALQMALDGSFFEDLAHAISSWLKCLNTLSEMFSGEILLDRQEQLQHIEQSMKKWSAISVSVVQHHVTPSSDRAEFDVDGALNEEQDSDENGEEHGYHPPSVHSLEGVNAMLADVDVYVKDLSIRTSGENGIAVSFVHLITPMEGWETKFNLTLSSDARFLIDSDIQKLVSHMTNWLEIVQQMSGTVSKTNKSTSSRQVEASVISHNVDKWCSLFSRAIQVEDGQVIDQVTETHSSLVKWMAEILLYLSSAEDGPAESTTPRSATPISVMPRSATPRSATLRSATPMSSFKRDSINDVFEHKSSCKYLCEHLDRFTKEIYTNCSLILEETITNATSSRTNLEMEGEKEELQVFCDESANWIRLSSVLVDNCVNEYRKRMEDQQDADINKEQDNNIETETEDIDDGASNEDEDKQDRDYSPAEREKLLRTVLTVDTDDNVSEIDNTYRQKSAETQSIADGAGTVPLKELGLSTEAELPEGRGVLLKDAEKMVLELKELKLKLAESEAFGQNEKKRADTSEKKLMEVENQLSTLSDRLKLTQKELSDCQNTMERNKKSSKSQRSKDKRKQQ